MELSCYFDFLFPYFLSFAWYIRLVLCQTTRSINQSFFFLWWWWWWWCEV